MALLSRGSEHPIPWCSELCRLLPHLQHVEQTAVDGEKLPRLLILHSVNTLTNDATVDQKLAGQPINVCPLECETFTDSQAKQGAE